MTTLHTRAPWRRTDGTPSIADLVAAPVVVGFDTTCEVVDIGFRSQWATGSVLVSPRLPGDDHGLVARKDFLSAMTGRYGFGRSLLGRRPIAELTRWNAPRVRVDASLTEAATLLVDSEDGYMDMVVVDDAGSPVGILDPTTLMEALAAELAHQAAHDHLTGVASRSGFVDGLRGLCTEAGDDSPVVLAFIDLDRLKEVNDTLGHSFGDALLTSVAQRLAACARPGDCLGRLGGDEFALARLLPPGTPAVLALEQAVALGEQLRAAVAAPDPLLPVPAHSRASIGLAVSGGAAVDDDQLLRDADVAMYEAKKAGGDRVQVADPSRAMPRDALVTDHLEVHYQPIVTTDGGHVQGVEALLRCRDADGRLAGPEGPLGAAAQRGRHLELDLWVLGQACRDFAAWQRDLPAAVPTSMNVNLSCPSLIEPDLAAQVVAVIDAEGVARGDIRMELSEAATWEEIEQAGSELQELRRAGVRIALDDLGSALSGMRHITQLPVDAVKIDRSVIAGMLSDSVDSMIVTVLHQVAVDRGLSVVAEGVEHADQLAALRSAGVDLVQGFLLARPMPADELRAYLTAHA